MTDWLKRVTASGTAQEHEFRILRPDGAIRHVWGESRCELDESGKVRALFGVDQDVTEKKSAGMALHKAKGKVEKNAILLQTTWENISETIALYDADGRLVLWNLTFSRIFHDFADMLVPGMRYEDLIRARAGRGLVPDALGRAEEWVREHMAQFRNPAGPIERRFCDGSWWRVAEQRVRQGGIVQVWTDITDLRSASATLPATPHPERG